MQVKLSPAAEKDLKKLSKVEQKRVRTKLLFFSEAENPLQFAKPLKNLPPAQYRFRIGILRLSFFIENQQIVVISIKHRKEIYR